MRPAPLVPKDNIRAAFSAAMSELYQSEVPLYGDLLEIVAAVNAEVLRERPSLKAKFETRGELERLGDERHGAIRVGTPAELSILRRAFSIMGMHPVGYYDLAVAGVPVHSTAFRPIDPRALTQNPFRIFTSLLRPELISDDELRQTAEAILSRRRIITPETLALIETAEANGGLTSEEAGHFVNGMHETFRWHGEALVDTETYARLHNAHRLVADIVSFRGPHINHLTPRTLDIDKAQEEMQRRGIDAKAVIEGPPRRRVPVLLRQTSFKALEENIRFSGQEGGAVGTHTARFGEIEQRGAALTPKGRKLYDRLLGEARSDSASPSLSYEARLAEAFRHFPDNEDELRKQGLAYFRYSLVEGNSPVNVGNDLDALIESGCVKTEPLIYEDFLPVSAAGIFQSNLGGEAQHSYAAQIAQEEFEAALGGTVLDPFALYAVIELESRNDVISTLSKRMVMAG